MTGKTPTQTSDTRTLKERFFGWFESRLGIPRHSPEHDAALKESLRTKTAPMPSTRLMDAVEGETRWRAQEPHLPGLAPSPPEAGNARVNAGYHAETDRMIADRVQRETLSPVTYRESLNRVATAEETRRSDWDKLMDDADHEAKAAPVRSGPDNTRGNER